MRIGVDARNFVARLTGIGRTVVEMCRALAAAGHDLVLYLPDEPHPTVAPSLPEATFRIFRAPGAARRILWGETTLPRAAAQDGIDAFWGPAHRLPTQLHPRIARVVTIHDLVWAHAAGTMRRRGFLADRMLMPRAVRIADRIAAASRATAADIVSAFPDSASRVRVVPVGVTPLPPPDRDFLARQGIDRPYALFVGTLEPRKNLFALLAAFAGLPAEVRRANLLVVAGGQGWRLPDLSREVDRLGLAEAVRVTGHVPDAGLSALYAGARFLAMPSRYEGFGIPIVEANAAGRPALVSNVSSMPEVAGEAGLLVDPDTVESIRDGLLTLFCDDGLHARLSARATANAARFDWAESARLLAALLDESRAARGG